MLDPDLLYITGTAATALRWQLSRRARGAPDTPVPEPTEPAAPPLARRWDERVGGQGCRLPGSRITHVAPIRNGTEALVQLVPGKQTAWEAMAAVGHVASALEMPLDSVVVEPTADRIASHARLLVLERNPQHQVRDWPGPSLSVETGAAQVGFYADEEPAMLRWLTPGSGAVHNLMAGTTGSGKSRMLDLALCESWAATYPHPDTGAPVPWIHTWVGDGQGGQSVPDWLDLTPWPATTTGEVLRMLRALRRVMYARSTFLRRFPWTDDKGRDRRGLKHFDPVLCGMPLIQVVLDECQGPMAEVEEIVKLTIEIGKMGRKCGIRLVYATQVPSAQNLGGSVDARSMLAGNVVCFRTRDRVSGGMAFAGGMEGIDPSTLPETFPNGEPTGGLGYLLGPGARPAAMRSFRVGDPYDLCVDLPLAELHPVDLAAAGDDYTQARQRFAETDALLDFPTSVSLVPDPEPAPAPLVVAERDPRVRDLVLEVVGDEDTTRAEVLRRLAEREEQQPSVRAVGDALAALTDEGVIVKVGRGVYRQARAQVPA